MQALKPYEQLLACRTYGESMIKDRSKDNIPCLRTCQKRTCEGNQEVSEKRYTRGVWSQTIGKRLFQRLVLKDYIGYGPKHFC